MGMEIWTALKKIIIALVILLFVILIGYEFENFREIIKNIIVGLFNENIAKSISFIYVEFLRNIFKKIIYVVVVFFIINYLITKYLKNNTNEFDLGDDLFNKALYNYLKSNNKRCFVVSGDWGVGKTYNI